jgi:inositol-polyphosphate multikinase
VHDNLTAEPVFTPKSYGKAIKESELANGFARFFPVHDEPASSTLGLPQRTLIPILHGIRESVARIREAYSPLEMRIIGGSLLIMYEADWNLAEEGLKRTLPRPLHKEHRTHSHLPYTVKLVDFAHTRLSPGLGPDEGVLLGLDTMLRLLDGRIAELGDP